MARAKKHAAEEIVNKLRQAEVELLKGATIAHACKQIPAAETTDEHNTNEFSRYIECESLSKRQRSILSRVPIDANPCNTGT